ncbi:hypothetical protein [Malacoplasma muris]|uniref:hypothetical protein n=1 Tax=Malacoplasma muris TaxID=2119 RepID=UPI00398EC2A6
MFSVKVTKEIIKRNLDSILSISNEIKDSDISIANKNITIRLHIIDLSINYVEIAKMLQKQLAYELNEATDSRDYKVDVILGE